MSPHISKKQTEGPEGDRATGPRDIGAEDSSRIFCDPSARGAAGARHEIMLVPAEGELVMAAGE